MNTKVSSDNAINSTTPQDVPLEKTDRHRNLIEKSPKTDTELKIVNSNTQKNFTSVKLSKSEPYNIIPPSPIEDDNKKSESLKKKVAERVQFEDNKENTIKKDTNEKKREENSRAIDIDIQKYVSPDFHSKNNVFTIPSSSDTEKYIENISSDAEKYIENIFDHRSSTQKLTDFSNYELTTPKNDFFDNKFKEAVQSIDQKLEHIDIEENENDDTSKELQVEKLIEEYRTTPNSNLDFKELKNVIKNNTIDKNSAHNDMTVEQMKSVNFETSFNDTKVYDDEDNDEGNNDKYVKGDTEKLETTTPKNNFILTTRKSVTLTKPPSNRNNSHILSNNIEIDIPKAVNFITTQLPTTKKAKGDDEIQTSSATSNIELAKENTIKRPTEKSLAEEQTIHANHVISTDATIQGNHVSSTTEMNFTPKITTFNVVEKETAISEEQGRRNVETTTIIGDVTTNNIEIVDEPKITSSPIQLTPEITTTLEQQTEPFTQELTTTIRNESVTAPKEESTTINDELITTTEKSTVKEDLEWSDTTSDIDTSETTTAHIEEITTSKTNDKTTEIGTTENGFRSSKGLVFEYLTTTDSITDTTTDRVPTTTLETTENNVLNKESSTNNIDFPVNTETNTAEVITTSKSSVTGVPTINKIVRVTVNKDSNSPKTTKETSPVTTEIATTTLKSAVTDAPRVNNNLTTSSPVDLATNEYLNERTENKNLLPVTIKPTPNSTIEFIHIENIDSNHTTLLPETLSPSFNYPTSDIGEPIEARKKESRISNTTTEDVEEGTEITDTEKVTTDSPSDKNGTIAAIVISTVGALCLVLLAGLLQCRPVSLDDYSMDNVSVYNSTRRKGGLRLSKRSYGNPAFDDPAAVTHPLNFPALAKFANNTEDIKAEFEDIPQIAARTSELPEGCETKNRYANVIPLPETRGPKNTKGYYIACQGPLENTVDDFWRMVWEQQSKVILMITHLFENGVEKCVDYLPPSEVLDCHRLFGDFQITLKKREVKDKYIISSLQLKNMVSNSWREVTHFWYMGWPEKGVPSEANSLIAFLIEARSFMKSSTLDKNAAANGNIQNGTSHNEVNPVVVHCSPGTGRTGVVIACDIAIREFEQTRLVDIPKIVYRIRRDRASAVQTKEQYMFIYKVVSLYATKLTGGALDSF
ncbi:hypothetical protein NQ314_003860 [Rhamnusium bicolor]|uniref:Uncharacterized protein n=1 Tax=Rhamnusium bicolor TaxID=1586634 RepID=A0AAV8ZNE0_9CUCU|nr:hypothetical protein NQ314_003860 [Rhamnusium bicolor]